MAGRKVHTIGKEWQCLSGPEHTGENCYNHNPDALVSAGVNFLVGYRYPQRRTLRTEPSSRSIVTVRHPRYPRSYP